MSHRIHLAKDKKLKKIMESQEEYSLRQKKNVCLELCASIMSQQLSTKVAAVIYGRFLALFSTKSPGPDEILTIPFDVLRNIGLSNAKTNYVRNVCEFFIAENLNDKKLRSMTRDEVHAKLVQIKGVGKWTVEMLLMFSLAEEDVFAPGDLGIQNAMIALYGLDVTNKKQLASDMISISEKWSPYKTYACLYLWGWKDKK